MIPDLLPEYLPALVAVGLVSPFFLVVYGGDLLIAIFGPKKPDTGFVDWCRNIDGPFNEPNVDEVQASGVQNNTRGDNSNERWPEIFINTIVEVIDRPEYHRRVIFDLRMPIDDCTITTPQSYSRYFSELSIKNNPFDNIAKTLTLSGLYIKRLSIGGKCNNARLVIDNCHIAHIFIHHKFDSHKDRFEVRSIYIDSSNTKIGKLEIQSNTVSHFHMSGGCVLDIDIPVPGSVNPFNGSVSFDDKVFFPKKARVYLLQDAQPFRNMRHHLSSLENATAANLFHSLELAVERENDARFTRLISNMYGLFSNYGRSPLKPVLCLVGLFLISATIIYASHGAIAGPPIVHPKEEIKFLGWLSTLKLPDAFGARSLYLSTQAIYNPLGIFGSKYALVLPKNGWIALLLGIQSIFSLTFLTLFIFAVRRRFKIHE